MEELPLDQLRISELNPRIADDKFYKKFDRSAAEFGDLSGIVRNLTTGNLVGGNQRTTRLGTRPDAKVIITERYKDPTPAGTMAIGYLLVDGERWSYREVQWDENLEMAARIVANALRAEWDNKKLGEQVGGLLAIDDDLARLTGFDDDQLKALAQGGVVNEDPEGNEKVRPKVSRYTSDDLRAHAARFSTRVTGISPELAASTINAFCDYLDIPDNGA